MTEDGGHLNLVQALLELALQAQRNGSLPELLREHPLAARWLVRRYQRVLSGTAGDTLPSGDLAPLASLGLRWLVTQLRPDSDSCFDGIGEAAWLQLAAWRPMLAVASHAGMLAVPDFPRQYRRRSGEAALDNLCGLWAVGPSTVYRMMERARHAMARVLVDANPDVARRMGLRRFVAHELLAQLQLVSDAQKSAWHQHQALLARARRDPVSEIWHHWQAADLGAFVQTLRQHAAVLANEPETDALVERLALANLTPRQRVDLWLARGVLARTRGQAERELLAYEQARAVAQTVQEPLLLGIALSAMGKYFEPRDADRAFACYQESAEFLRDLGPETGDVHALEHFVTTFARLAWLYLLRNDERCKPVLDQAEALRARFKVPDDVLGMLEQVWGLYWAFAGDPVRSLEHSYRALVIFERLGDQRSTLAAYVNIGFDLSERGDHERAIELSQRVLAAAERGFVEPDLVIGAHSNLGIAYFWKGQLDRAIAEYSVALEKSLAWDQRMFAFRIRYNLAEAHYVRFRDRGDPADESAGDAYVQDLLSTDSAERSQGPVEAARSLKASVLSHVEVTEADRILPGDAAIHSEELAQVSQHRAVLALPAAAEEHVRAHLAIAQAYAAIAAQAREAALTLIAREGLRERFAPEFAELQRTFEREMSREQQLARHWAEAAVDMLDEGRRMTVILHLLREGAINKSRYAELGEVAPATASKHLALLAERGLLLQLGKGPSTRYELPG